MTTNHNRKYKKGADKERQIVNEFRKKGCLSFRSAGSHSPIDVFVLNPKTKEIFLIQSKAGKSYTPQFKEKLYNELRIYEGFFNVKVGVW